MSGFGKLQFNESNISKIDTFFVLLHISWSILRLWKMENVSIGFQKIMHCTNVCVLHGIYRFCSFAMTPNRSFVRVTFSIKLRIITVVYQNHYGEQFNSLNSQKIIVRSVLLGKCSIKHMIILHVIRYTECTFAFAMWYLCVEWINSISCMCVQLAFLQRLIHTYPSKNCKLTSGLFCLFSRRGGWRCKP